MKRIAWCKTARTAGWLLVPCIALAQNVQLSLRHGTYVREPYACKGQPNAAILSWDGMGFSGAHSSKCTSRISSRRGNQFELSTACAALGDGSPNPSGKPDIETLTLTRLSNSRFRLVTGAAEQGTWRWCGAGSPASLKEKL